jgi:hypothetical protein
MDRSMTGTSKNWNDRAVQIARSRGGKISVLNYEDNLIVPSRSVWPHPDILKKLHRSSHSKDFDQASLEALSAKFGFYCDLQSLRSEDAITWSIFGTLKYFSKSLQVQFVNSLLEAIGEELNVKDCLIQLWTRIAHPDTLVSGGPELDFQIIGDKVVIFGECKWTAKVAENQGKQKNKNQLQLRKEYLEKYGKRIFPNVSRQLVLVVGLTKPQNPVCPNITWEEVCNNTQHPLKQEISRYYHWKKEFGQ